MLDQGRSLLPQVTESTISSQHEAKTNTAAVEFWMRYTRVRSTSCYLLAVTPWHNRAPSARMASQGSVSARTVFQVPNGVAKLTQCQTLPEPMCGYRCWARSHLQGQWRRTQPLAAR